MDQALAKELQAFKKRNVSNVTTPSRVPDDPSFTRKRKVPANRKAALPKTTLPPQILNGLKKNNQKNDSHQQRKSYYCKNKNRTALLACVVDFLKDTYLLKDVPSEKDGNLIDNRYFTFEEFMDETQNLDTDEVDRLWLKDNLKSNPRICYHEGKYRYRPYYEITDKRSLLKLFETYNDNGLGGVLLDELRESFANADDHLISLRNKVYHISRSSDKKDVLFYYDSQYYMNMEDTLKTLWKASSTDNIDTKAIERYLSMANIKHFSVKLDESQLDDPKKDKKKGRGRTKKVHNIHLADGVLKDYE